MDNDARLIRVVGQDAFNQVFFANSPKATPQRIIAAGVRGIL